jgi:hypothetical protein
MYLSTLLLAEVKDNRASFPASVPGSSATSGITRARFFRENNLRQPSAAPLIEALFLSVKTGYLSIHG